MHCTVVTGPRPGAEGDARAIGAGAGPDGALASSADAIPARPTPSARLWPLVLGALLTSVAAALVPAPALADTKTWTGVISGANWTNDANWAGLVAPVADDDLVFPSNAFRRTTNNDYPDGTSFNSITISDSIYTLNGNTVSIGFSQIITASYPTGVSTINLPITGNSIGFNVINAGATLVFGGSVLDSGGSARNGNGTLVFLGASTSHLAWRLQSGATDFNGSQPSTSVIVNSGATLGGTGTTGP